MVGSRLAEAVSRLHAAFVGRDAQMQHLLHRWSEAEAGTLGWVLLAGQPGIGKTRLARELARAVQQRHAAVLWGSCLEADWRPPYGPWLEALRSCAEDADLPRLAEALGPAAALVRPLLPEFGALAPAPPAPAALSPREERIRRYDAAQRLLARLAERQPLLLVLDDVHWADPDSLELLAYLARCLPRRQRMLVIVAYRDTQLDRTNARGFVDLLVALEKDEQTDRITLRGLAKSDVEELLAQVALRSPSARLTHSIWSEAAGHPFYTRELVRHVLDQGQLAIRATAESDASPAEPLAVPEGVQTLLDQRLSRLSAPAAGVLTTACVLAGGFGLPILQALTGLAAAPLSAALGEGLAAGLLRATSTAPAGFDFAHAIVRHALADRLTPDTRAALHRRAAEALEQLPSSHAEHAAEIAAHYAASAALPGSERGIDFALAAAEHARTAFAHERVVACLRLARDLSAAAEPAARANILSQLAIAEASALYLADAPRTAEAAVAAILAHRAEPRRAAELLASIARPLKDAGADTSAWEPLVERGLALVGDQHDLTWARLKLLQDCAEPVAEGLVYARRWLGYDAEAVAIARRLGTEADYANTLETFDWRTPEETAQVLGLARTWRAPSAILRALNVAARDTCSSTGCTSGPRRAARSCSARPAPTGRCSARPTPSPSSPPCAWCAASGCSPASRSSGPRSSSPSSGRCIGCGWSSAR